MKASDGGLSAPAGGAKGKKEGAEAGAGGGSPDGPAQLHTGNGGGPSGVQSDVIDKVLANILSSAPSGGPRLSPPLAVPGAPPQAASAPLTPSAGPAVHVLPASQAPAVLLGGGVSPLIAKCFHCHVVGPTSSYILCNTCCHPAFLYCSSVCREAHRPKHQGEVEGEGEDEGEGASKGWKMPTLASEDVKEKKSQDLKESECEVYKRKRQIAEALGMHLPPPVPFRGIYAGNPSQGHAAAAATLRKPPIVAKCSLCDSIDQVDVNGHKLVRPCRRCEDTWVHPTCLTRAASQEGTAVLKAAVMDYSTDFDAEEQLAHDYQNTYLTCCNCNTGRYVGPVSLALAELAIWDSEFYTYGGQE